MNNDKKLLIDLCRHLKARREKLGISQARISEIMGLNQSNISRFEDGQIDSAVMLYRYTAILKIIERGEFNDR